MLRTVRCLLEAPRKHEQAIWTTRACCCCCCWRARHKRRKSCDCCGNILLEDRKHTIACTIAHKNVEYCAASTLRVLREHAHSVLRTASWFGWAIRRAHNKHDACLFFACCLRALYGERACKMQAPRNEERRGELEQKGPVASATVDSYDHDDDDTDGLTHPRSPCTSHLAPAGTPHSRISFGPPRPTDLLTLSFPLQEARP